MFLVEDEDEDIDDEESDTVPDVQNGTKTTNLTVGKVLNEADFAANIVREKAIETFSVVPRISKFTSTGEVTIEFSKNMEELSEEIDLKELEFKDELGQWKPVLSVTVNPAELQDPTKVGLDWEIIEYSGNTMKIQLTFEDPIYISHEKEPDTLVITFADEDLFISETGIKIEPEHRTLTRPIVRQLPEENVDTQDSIMSLAGGGDTLTTVLLIFNLVASFGL